MATNILDGKIFFDTGLPADNLLLRLYSVGFGGKPSNLGEATTDMNGAYSISYLKPGLAASLEIRAVDPQQQETVLTAPKFNLQAQETSNLIAPSSLRPLASEYQRLSNDLQKQIGTIDALGGAQEDGGRKDLQILYEGTGWDARLVALAATAQQRSQATGIGADIFYGLLRTGMSSDLSLLTAAGKQAITDALTHARNANIVALSDAQISAAAGAFDKLAPTFLGGAKAAGAPSTFSDLLTASGISPADQQAFGPLYFFHDGGDDVLWQKAKDAGLSPAAVSALQTQGKLALLTLNNATLIASVQQQLPNGDVAGLVTLGLHDPSAWKTRLLQLAGNDDKKLQALIPDVFTGKGSERLDAYAGDLARRVRTSFPTAVVGALLGTNLVFGPRHQGLEPSVRAFLQAAQPLGFLLGRTPVDRFLAANGTLADAPTAAAVKQLHRLYQVSPSNESLKALLDGGFDSAAQIAALPLDVFVARFGAAFPSLDEAQLVHRKAQQVNAVTYNIVAAAKQIDVAPPMRAVSPSPERRREARENLIVHFPSLASLLGSTDFCECEDCGSVLSPAAYLVDLFQFLSPANPGWSIFTGNWSAAHGEDYALHHLRPFEALMARRPDLQNLLLSCANTNTLMPYIDIVNEVLELQVAGQLVAVYNSDDTTPSADLLAQPQHVNAAAYTQLKTKNYPLTLPFDRPLEVARRFFALVGTPLWRALDVFRPTDALFAAGSPPPAYARADVLAESLGIGPDEYRLYTSPPDWWTLYGYGAGEEAAAASALTSARTLAARLGVSYRELADLVQTNFLNPAPYGNGQHIQLVAADLTGCDFSTTTLRYADGTLAGAPVFLAMHLLVRLWRRLGWTLAELDGALARFAPAPFAGGNIGATFKTALVYLAHFDALFKRIGGARLDLLSIWAQPGTSTPGDLDALLGRAFQLSPADFAALKLLSGLNPATPLIAGPLTTIDDDRLFQQTLRFSDAVDAVRASGFSVSDLDYLFAHRFDPVGPYRFDKAAFDVFARSLATALAAVRSDNAVPDLSVMTDDWLRQKLALVLPAAVVETFFGMWTGNLVYEASVSPVAAADQLLPAAFADDPAITLSYDAVTQTQRLRHRGVLVTARKNALVLAHPTAANLPALLEAVRAQAAAFFAAQLQLRTLDGNTVGFLSAVPEPGSDYVHLFAAPADGGVTDAARREILAGAFLPYLRATLTRQLIAQAVTAHLAADHRLVETLLTHRELLDDGDGALLDAFAALPDRGVSARLFASSDGTGASSDVTLDTAELVAAPTTNSARLTCWLEVADAGPYRFYLHLDRSGASAALALDGRPLTMSAAADGDQQSAVIELVPNVSYQLTVDAGSLAGGGLAVSVESEHLARGPLSQLSLRPGAVIDRVTRALLLVQKTVQLVKGLKLNERELRHLLSHAADFDGLSLSALPTAPLDAADAGVAGTLFQQFLRLAAYAQLRLALCRGADDLIDIFAAARATLPPGRTAADFFSGLCAMFGALIQIDAATVSATATRLGLATVSGTLPQVESLAFADERGLARLYAGLQIMQQLGAPVTTPAPDSWIMPAPTSAIADAMVAAARSRSSADAWRATAKPIFDELRRRQRDALVAYLFTSDALAPYFAGTDGGDALDQLYEYFLIDPGTEPVVQTSRLRLAISAVQLFIQRCFLNLEGTVPASALDAKQWQWMKRYRVWEANRKIFLFPENWLEPEFRDDKTALFTAFEGGIAQGDITDDLAEDVFFTYLDQLEQVARLELVSLYRDEPSTDPAATVLHVIGRTFSVPHKYFYRQWAHGSWTPWAPVSVQVQGDHVAFAVWRGRSFLFWVTFMDTTNTDSGGSGSASLSSDGTQATVAKVTPHQMSAQLSWSEYSQGKWSAPVSSDYTAPIPIGTQPLAPNTIFIHISKEPDEAALKINLSGTSSARSFAFRVVSRHSKPTVDDCETPLVPPYPPFSLLDPTRYLSGSEAESLGVYFEETLTRTEILAQATDYSLLLNGTRSPWRGDELEMLESELFFADEENTFFVQPTVSEASLVEYTGWAVELGRASAQVTAPNPAGNVLVPVVPHPPVGDPFPIESIDPAARFQLAGAQDWIAGGSSTVLYGGQRIGQSGTVGSELPAVGGEVVAG